MNHTSAFAEPCVGGHHAFIRLPRDGRAKPILAKGGSPKVYPSEKAALQAIIRHLCEHANGNMRRDGERAGRLLAEADKLFRGGGKVVRVEKRRRRR